MAGMFEQEYRAALESLYQNEEKRLFNIVLRWVWNTNDAMDIVQEAFVRLWATRESVDWTTARPYIYRIAINQAANRRRFLRLKRFVSLDAEPLFSRHQGAEKIFTASAMQKDVAQAIDALPEALRSVLVMSEISEMSYEEIAAVLQIPSGTVGSRRNRALAVLRKQLGEWK